MMSVWLGLGDESAAAITKSFLPLGFLACLRRRLDVLSSRMDDEPLQVQVQVV